MTVIFEAKTDSEGFELKNLAELLANNLKTVSFTIDNKVGIYLKTSNSDQTVFIDVLLDSSKFSVWEMHINKIHLGLNLNEFYKELKNAKKKDSVKLQIDDDTPNELLIEIVPKERNKLFRKSIKIQDLQQIDIIDFPVISKDYKHLSFISSDLQKIIKEVCYINNEVKITAKNSCVIFKADDGGIRKGEGVLGNIDDKDKPTSSSKVYEEIFNSKLLIKIMKISGLNKIMQIFPNYPLALKSNIGNLGEINLFIKSNKEIKENKNFDD